MPRKPRCYIANVPCHVITRGNNRQDCFFAEGDYEFYLECLRDACTRYHVSLHAYVLMTNHVHLLMTPQTTDGISRVMQSIGRRYVQHVNFKYRRSGTLWEGRYKASLVEQETYLLVCYRYIELNPVRAKMVTNPGDYKWSSFRQNTGLDEQRCVIEHECFRRLGSTKADRYLAYRELFSLMLGSKLIGEVRRAANCSMPLGGLSFQSQIEQEAGSELGHAKRGRTSS